MTTRIKLDKYITGVDPDTGREIRARIDSDKSLTVLHPKTGAEFAKVTIAADGTASMQVLGDATKSPHTAGLCLKECSTGCNGDMLCVAGCALECATIIID